jgi:hypothetical protein
LKDLRDDEVDIDLPIREEIERALKYLKNNKAVGASSIAAKLLKNGMERSWRDGMPHK